MVNEFTQVTNQWWFRRLGGAVKGILFGLALFALALVLLFWNEGRAVKRQKALEEGGGKEGAVAADKVELGGFVLSSSLVTIAIARVFYRPVLGVALLAAAVVLMVLVVKKLKGGKALAAQHANG